MTVFAIFTYTEFFKHKSAEGEKMNKKTTGIIAYITWIGWIVAFCAGDKEGAKFHLNQALVILIGQFYPEYFPVCMLDHGSDLCLPGAGERSPPDRSD